MTRKPRRAELGVSVAEYDRLLAAQCCCCAICGNPPKSRRLDVDHDHKTGQVRGLLCHRCNRVLASWVTAEWLFEAAAYLEPGSVTKVETATEMFDYALRELP